MLKFWKDGYRMNGHYEARPSRASGKESEYTGISSSTIGNTLYIHYPSF